MYHGNRGSFHGNHGSLMSRPPPGRLLVGDASGEVYLVRGSGIHDAFGSTVAVHEEGGVVANEGGGSLDLGATITFEGQLRDVIREWKGAVDSEPKKLDRESRVEKGLVDAMTIGRGEVY